MHVQRLKTAKRNVVGTGEEARVSPRVERECGHSLQPQKEKGLQPPAHYLDQKIDQERTKPQNTNDLEFQRPVTKEAIFEAFSVESE